jgi:hypothetical protein
MALSNHPPFPIDDICTWIEPQRPLSERLQAPLRNAVYELATTLEREGDRLAAMLLLYSSISDAERAAFQKKVGIEPIPTTRSV